MAPPIRATGYTGPIICDQPGCGKVAIGSSVGGEIEPGTVEPPNTVWDPVTGTIVVTKEGVKRPGLGRTAKPKINYCGVHTNLPFSPDAEHVMEGLNPDGTPFYDRKHPAYANGGNAHSKRVA